MTTGFERVETDRLVLLRPAAEDLAAILRVHADPLAVLHNPADALADASQAEQRLRLWERQWSAGLGYWTVRLREGGGTIGFCGVKAAELADAPIWNLLYRFDPAAWGRGYAREAAAAALVAARTVDAERPVVARVRPRNAASARVAAAIGLVRRPELDVEGDDGVDEVWSTPGGEARIP